MYQQTVELAIDTETDGRIEASELLAMPESDFSALRRLVMVERNARKRGESTKARLLCANCKAPLWLSRYRSEAGNRWFVHDGPSLDCPWYEGNRLSPDLRRALIYRGQQEGARHRSLKEFIASWLEKEPGVSRVDRELVTHGQVLKGEWKRPDVQCVKDGKRIVFEIQLSYTFLSDVIKRDEFYQAEGIFIIWVFDVLDLRRATVRDEAFFNRRNVFVLDKEAMQESTQRGRLTFSGTFQRPVLNGEVVEDEWQSKFISLDDVQFPEPSYRPYFFDYGKERQTLEEALAERKCREKEEQLQRAIQRREEEYAEFCGLAQLYLKAAVRYYDSDYAAGLKQPVLEAAEGLERHQLWHRGFEVLSYDGFYGWHRVLPVLLSLKHDRPIGYKYQSAFQVLEAGLRQTTEDDLHGMSVLYLWACKVFKPTLTDKQRSWVKAQAEKVKRSIEAGEATYLRTEGYDEAVSLLFPELEDKLCSTFATRRWKGDDASASWRQDAT